MLSLIKKVYRNYIIKKAVKDGLNLGENCIFYGIPYFGTEPYLIKIGNDVSITDGVLFLTHDGATAAVRKIYPREHLNRYGSIEIGNNCFIGMRTIILPNVKIGDNCILGAGSVITKNVESNSVVAGNPGKYICSFEEYSKKAISQTILQKGHSLTDLKNYFWNK